DGENADVVPDIEGENERVTLARHFLECVREGRQPISSAEQGVWVTRMLDGLYRSAASGREIRLDSGD
ncbi:MAG TPA: Gfo/Idh/MocA family oxidoreductase, partial [Limnochordia bacterium]